MLKKGFYYGLIVGAILGISAVGYIYYVSKKSIELSESVKNKKSFKDLNLIVKDLEGKPLNIADYKDKKVLVNFWGTWCAPCVKEMPLLQEVYNDINDKYIFIMISDEDTEKIKSFKEKNKYNFLFAKSETDLKAVIGVFPTTFILDRNQNIEFALNNSVEDYSKDSLSTFLVNKIK